jgi:TonB family protein
MTWYLGAADKGNAQAQNNIGWLYESGLGVNQDYAEAMAWYYRAADQGLAQAQTNIGWLYQNGFGIKQDYAAAMTWYRKAADQGDAQAEGNIGSLYESGLGVQQNHDEALNWYRKSGHRGVLVVSNGIRAPRAIYAPDPEYSLEARKAKLNGTVVLWLIVGPDGQPIDIKVVKSLGHGLDEEAIDAVKRWKFDPGTKDGKPVAIQINVEINFHLFLSD